MKIYSYNFFFDISFVAISPELSPEIFKENVVNTIICGQCGFITTPKMMLLSFMFWLCLRKNIYARSFCSFWSFRRFLHIWSRIFLLMMLKRMGENITKTAFLQIVLSNYIKRKKKETLFLIIFVVFVIRVWNIYFHVY